ncbi:MAG: hypothetical protein ABIV25_06010 [Paracoccaceae bacterium]
MADLENLIEPIEPQPATITSMPDPLPAEPVKPRRNSIIGPVFGGILAALIGFGVAQLVPNGWPIADTSALEAKVAAQDSETKALATKIADLAKTPPPTDKSLADRLTAIESTLSTPAVDTTNLDQRLTALEQRLTAIEALPSDGTSASPAAIAQLQSDIAALKSGGSNDALQKASDAIDAKLADADTKLAAITSRADATVKSAATHSAIRQIAAALDSGAPFGTALTDLADAKLPPILIDNAKTGLPSQQSLIATFPDAARAALDTSLRADVGQGWTDRVSAFLRNQTGARSLTPHEGTDPDAILSRAEAALRAGDLGTVLTELASLPPEGQAAMADWTAQCTKRQDAILAVQSLSASMGG